MGQLIYASDARIEIDDRTLAHLQIVILNKLRRRECFAFSWRETDDEGSGRGTIWIASEISLRFMFVSSRPPAINRRWIDALMTTANTPAGLHVVPEPPEDPEAGERQPC